MIVLDASAVLATLLGEAGGDFLKTFSGDCAISTFNFAEVISKLTEKRFTPAEAVLVASPFQDWCIPVSTGHAIQAGVWRMETRRSGLSLGDRCCLALGLELGADVYTTNRAWAALDLGVKVRVIR